LRQKHILHLTATQQQQQQQPSDAVCILPTGVKGFGQDFCILAAGGSFNQKVCEAKTQPPAASKFGRIYEVEKLGMTRIEQFLLLPPPSPGGRRRRFKETSWAENVRQCLSHLILLHYFTETRHRSNLNSCKQQTNLSHLPAAAAAAQ
jgi:hypothetical protein